MLPSNESPKGIRPVSVAISSSTTSSSRISWYISPLYLLMILNSNAITSSSGGWEVFQFFEDCSLYFQTIVTGLWPSLSKIYLLPGFGIRIWDWSSKFKQSPTTQHTSNKIYNRTSGCEDSLKTFSKSTLKNCLIIAPILVLLIPDAEAYQKLILVGIVSNSACKSTYQISLFLYPVSLEEIMEADNKFKNKTISGTI